MIRGYEHGYVLKITSVGDVADISILENGIKCGHPILLIAGNIDQDTVSIQSLWPIRLEVYRSMETARIKNLDDITFQLEAESELKGEEILGGRCFECNGSVMVGTHYSPYQKDAVEKAIAVAGVYTLLRLASKVDFIIESRE